jgi:hypothetical protein
MGIQVQNLDSGARRFIDDSPSGKSNTILSLDGSGGLGNRVLSNIVGTVGRSNTTATALGILPRGAVPVGIQIWGAAQSNAGTAATLSIGWTTGSELVSGFDVKGATGTGQQNPPATNLFAAASASGPVTVTGLYAESGAAGTAGGPWGVIIDYYVP